MLERAERRARRADVEVRWVEGDMRAFSFNEAFALVFVAFNSFLMPDPQIIAGLDGAVVDEWERIDPETGRAVRKFSSSHANVDGVTQRFWHDETADDGTVHRIGGNMALHYLYRRETELLFSEAGFIIETLHGDYDGNPADARSPKLLVVAKRRERGQGRERRRS